MIQRVQSIWLFIASALSFLTLKLSFYSGSFLQDNLYHQLNGTDNILLMIATIALGVLSLLNIFLYKTRVIQLRLCIIGILLDLLLLYLYFREIANYSQGTYSITAAAHLLILIALIFSARGISKDEKIVKDSDRLR
jgi:hypothetical protein